MGRLMLAWQVLTNGILAERLERFLHDHPGDPVDGRNADDGVGRSVKTDPEPSAVAAGPVRNDAVTLLATLQREGRLIDFLKEPIEAYSDAQVGAAVRDIHRDCGAALERQLAIRPVIEQPEGAIVSLDNPPDPGRLKLSGSGVGTQRTTGRLVHHGWQVTKCELPQWTGTASAAGTIAAAEVELSDRGN